ncbi:MAG: DUF1302 family protein [Candidatus Aminicenantia bacterium]
MKNIIILAFVIFSVTSPILQAQELEIDGFVEIDHVSYFKNNNESKINSRNQGILQMELRSSLGYQASIFSAVEFREDRSDPSRNRIYLDEAYIDLYLGNFDFRLGKQIIVWGKADGINPTDNITPWDFSDFLDTDDERIGVFALKANYYIGDWTFEGILIPIFTPSILPLRNSRWFPDFPEEISNPMYPASGSPTVKTSYEFLDQTLPDESFDEAQFAVKLSSTFSGWDVSLSYYSGWNNLATFHRILQPVSSDSLHIILQSKYHRRKVAGADFSTTSGKLGIRGEAAYYFTEDPNGEDPEIDDPYFQYVIGIDRTFSDLIGDNNLFVLIQWIQEIPKNNVEYRKDDLNHIFQKSITVRLEYELGNYAKLIVEGVYNIKGKDYYLRPNFSYEVTDAVTLDICGDILGGESDTFFGSYKDNKRVQVKMKYSF